MGDLFDGLIFDPAIFDTLPDIAPSGDTPSYLTGEVGFNRGLGYAITRVDISLSSSAIDLVSGYLQAKAQFTLTGNLAAYNAALEAILNE
jgi:hypothetical protein